MSKRHRIARRLIPLHCLLALIAAPGLRAQQLALTRHDAPVLVEPSAPNIVRVSISLRRDDALAAPGYGISASPAPTGWTVENSPQGDILRSDRMVVTIAPQGHKWTPTGTQADIAKFFNGSTPGVGV